MPYTCHLCGSSELVPLYGSLHEVITYRFVRCGRCRLIQVQQTRLPAEEEAFYEREYHTLAHKREEAVSRVGLFTALLNIVEQHASGTRLLDVGAGTGEFVAEARRRCWDADGVEISRAAVGRAAEQADIQLINGALETIPPSMAYDAITYWNVLDQLADPLQSLRQARERLNAGGIVACRVPNGAFHHRLRALCAPFPRLVRRYHLYEYFSLHLFSFTATTARRLFREAGFHPVTVLNSPVTRGDPSGRSKGFRLILLQAVKQTAGAAAAVLRGITLGRCHAAPSIVFVGRKADHVPVYSSTAEGAEEGGEFSSELQRVGEDNEEWPENASSTP